MRRRWRHGKSCIACLARECFRKPLWRHRDNLRHRAVHHVHDGHQKDLLRRRASRQQLLSWDGVLLRPLTQLTWQPSVRRRSFLSLVFRRPTARRCRWNELGRGAPHVFRNPSHGRGNLAVHLHRNFSDRLVVFGWFVRFEIILCLFRITRVLIAARFDVILIRTKISPSNSRCLR